MSIGKVRYRTRAAPKSEPGDGNGSRPTRYPAHAKGLATIGRAPTATSAILDYPGGFSWVVCSPIRRLRDLSYFQRMAFWRTPSGEMWRIGGDSARHRERSGPFDPPRPSVAVATASS